MSKPVVAIIPTTMRNAMENAKVMPGANPKTLKKCLGVLRSRTGNIRRRQMWNRGRSDLDTIRPDIR